MRTLGSKLWTRATAVMLGTALAGALARAQTPTPTPGISMGERIMSGDRSAIPELRTRFAAAASKLEKRDAAFGLVRLGDPDPVAWTYLAGEATIALDKDAPYPLEVGLDGKVVRGKMSASFLAWAAETKVDPRRAANDAIYSDPVDVLEVARTADPRAMPILLRGLASRNYMIVAVSALGLGRLQARRAIPDIEAAVKRVPADFRREIGKGLLFFDDPDTARKADSIVGKEAAERFRKILREQGPDAAL